MSNARLVITDGTSTVDLLNLRGYTLKDWKPSVPEPKGGGVFRSSPLVDGRRLTSRVFDNAIDTFELVVSAAAQDTLIYQIQELLRLMQKATEYWTTDWQNEPVWLEARSPCETYIRYAVVMDYRLTGLNNPYAQPFYNAINYVAMGDLSLLVEHKHWQETEPGADGTCVELKAQQGYVNIATADLERDNPAATLDDVRYTKESMTLDDGTGTPTLYVGDAGVTWGFVNEVGIAFFDVDVPQGAYIEDAFLSLYSAVDQAGGDFYIMIYVQTSPMPPSQFSGTVADYLARTCPSDNVAWFIWGWTNNTTMVSPSIKKLIQAVVDDPLWVSGSRLVLFIRPGEGCSKFSNNYVSFDSFDTVAGTPPQLTIRWSSTEKVYGRGYTCENEVMVGNKHNRAQITHSYWYDDSLAAFSLLNLIGSATPFEFLPNAPANNDLVYFGIQSSLENSGPFGNVVPDVSTVSTGIETCEWEYWNGAAWTDLDVCGNTYFNTLGVTSVKWEQPADWVANAINGITAYWVRMKITVAAGGATAPQQDNRDFYTVVTPYAEFQADSVPGDIPAMSRIIFDSHSCYDRRIATLSCGLRSMDRGEDFSAYLNASNEQNPDGITFNYDLDGVGALAADTEAPTGRSFTIVPTTTMAEICRWTIDPDYAKQYSGIYHAYVRVKHTVGAAPNVRFRLRGSFGVGYNVTYSSENGTSDSTLIHAIDLGQFVIPGNFSMRANEKPTLSTIVLDAMRTDTATIRIYDIVLLPADEWVGTFAATPTALMEACLYDGRRAEIDGITNPRQYRALLQTIVSDTTGTIDAEWFRIASSAPVIQSNRWQRLWFLLTFDTELYTYFEAIGSVRLQRSARWLALRGMDT